MKNLKEIDVESKRVLVRCDFNTPLGNQGNILDDFDIERTIPTIEYLVQKKAKVILMSHLDKPDGKIVEKLRLTPIQERLFEYLDVSIAKAPDCVGEKILRMTKDMMPGEILLLENLRFHRGEEENDDNFAKELASLGDVFINEAFGVCHRNHASIVKITEHLPSFAGPLLERELEVLTIVSQRPRRPFVVIFGGVKASTKIPAIKRLLSVADFVLVGGKLGGEIKFSDPKMILPEDYQENGFDIGQKTIKRFEKIIKRAKMIVWNGPMGYFEKKEFENGTREIAQSIAETDAFKVSGGGETTLAISRYNLKDKFDFISVGGGAMLSFLSGDKLPGLKALSFY